MNAEFLQTAKRLPLEERIELAEALWDSIADEGYAPSLTAEQAAELDRRLEEHRRNPTSGISWDQIKQEVEQKYARSK